MKFNIARDQEFIPKWKDNDKADDPIRVQLKYLTVTERDGIVKVDFDDNGHPRVKVDYPRACRVGIKKIEALTVDGRKIEKAQELLELPADFGDLAMEIGSHIVSANAIQSEDEGKNLP